jgi:hypothetical protein
MATGNSWRVEGDYFEGCSCDSTCPCIFLADPDKGDCQLTIAWHVEKGHFGSTSLDGLNVAGAFYAPGNMANGPKWQAALYVDQRATKEQSEALVKIFSGQAGGVPEKIAQFIGEVKGVANAGIEFIKDGRRRRLRIPSIAEMEIQALQGAEPNQEPQILNPALYGAAGFDPVIARTIHNTYRDHGFQWDNSGRNAFYSRFTYAS